MVSDRQTAGVGAADGLDGDMHFAHCAVDLSTWLMERPTIRNGTTDTQASWLQYGVETCGQKQ